MSDPNGRLKASRRTIVGLDLIRFASAVMVMLYHLTYMIWARPESTPARVAAGSVDYSSFGQTFGFGWVGVQIFFVLSGFVIAFSANGASPFQFARSRFLRLYPAVWICATVTLAAWLLLGRSDFLGLAEDWLRSVTLFPFGGWIDGVYWTLGVELAFYLLVFLVLMTGSIRGLPWLFYVLIVASGLFYMERFLVGDIQQYLPVRIARLLLLEHGAFFALGGLIWLGGATRWTKSFLAAALAAVVVCILQMVDAIGPYPDPIQWTAIAVWLAAVVAIVVSPAINGRLWSERVSGQARILGLATYPLYLLHDVVGAALIRAFSAFDELALLIVAPAIMAGALLVSLVLEPAIRRRISPWFDTLGVRLSRVPRLTTRTTRMGT